MVLHKYDEAILCLRRYYARSRMAPDKMEAGLVFWSCEPCFGLGRVGRVWVWRVLYYIYIVWCGMCDMSTLLDHDFASSTSPSAQTGGSDGSRLCLTPHRLSRRWLSRRRLGIALTGSPRLTSRRSPSRSAWWAPDCAQAGFGRFPYIFTLGQPFCPVGKCGISAISEHSIE